VRSKTTLSTTVGTAHASIDVQARPLWRAALGLPAENVWAALTYAAVPLGCGLRLLRWIDGSESDPKSRNQARSAHCA
jgi:hypothetical protein